MIPPMQNICPALNLNGTVRHAKSGFMFRPVQQRRCHGIRAHAIRHAMERIPVVFRQQGHAFVFRGGLSGFPDGRTPVCIRTTAMVLVEARSWIKQLMKIRARAHRRRFGFFVRTGLDGMGQSGRSEKFRDLSDDN